MVTLVRVHHKNHIHATILKESRFRSLGNIIGDMNLILTKMCKRYEDPKTPVNKLCHMTNYHLFLY